MLRVVVLRVLFFVDMRLPRIQCRRFVLSEVVFTLELMQITHYDTCVIIDYLTWFDGLHARCDM